MATERRVAADTTVMVNYLIGEYLGDHENARFRHSRWVIDSAKAGEFRLMIPSIVIAEIAGCPRVRSTEVPLADRKARVSKVQEWIHASNFTTVDIDDRVARLAADLAITHQLSGADACVVAAAKISHCETLFSWDTNHTKLGQLIEGIIAREPQALPNVQDALKGT